MYFFCFVQGIARTQSPLRKKYAFESPTLICGDRRGQPNRSAMERPHSGPTALVIAVQPVPGKYDCGWQNGNIIEASAKLRCLTPISITLHLWITSKDRRRRITCIGWARQSHRMKHCVYLLLHPILI